VQSKTLGRLPALLLTCDESVIMGQSYAGRTIRVELCGL
jgi:hypothetical protein